MPDPIFNPQGVQDALTDDEDDDTNGEFVDVEDDDSDVEPTDGGAYVDIDPETGAAIDANRDEWFANLADTLDYQVISALASDLLELVDLDKQAREKRDEQYEEGIRRTGLGDDAPGGAQFAGATRVVHPMLAEAAVDFASRAMKELFPAGGPAKDYIPGTPTKQKVAKAQRKTKHLNYQLTIQCKTLRTDLEQLMTQVPLGGAQYLHVDWDQQQKLPRFTPIYIDEMLLPYAATNYYGAERRTYWQTITQRTYEDRVASGLYIDADLSRVSSAPDTSKAQDANEKIEGKEQSSQNPDNERTVYRTSLRCWRMDGDEAADDMPAPYVVHIDVQSRTVLGIYRNWLEDDPKRVELIDTIEFPFIPWRGAYPIGLTHLIGGLSASATGALRALLDSALIQNFPGALKLKGTVGGQTTSVNATQLTEIDGGIVTDDIRKLVMPLPFNGPSQTLFQLLGFVTDTGKGVVQTSFDKLSEQNVNTPVGTTVALIDQGLTVYSAIHSRLHESMLRLLEVVHQLNKLYLDDEELKDDVGEILAYRRDYEGPVDVVPVSDPAISSEIQRFSKVQAVVQRADTHPDLYNAVEVETMWLEQLKIPDFERLLVKSADPKPLNAVNENLGSVGGRPLIAFPEQEHLAHLQVHLDFITKMIVPFGGLMVQALPNLINHIKDHVAMWYVAQVYDVMKQAHDGIPPEHLMDDDPDVSRMFDKTLALASMQVLNGAASMFQQVPPVIDQARQLIQQFSPPQPQDPSAAAAAASSAETQRRTVADRLKAQTDQAKLASDQQKHSDDMRLREEALQLQLKQAEDERNDQQALLVRESLAGIALEKQRGTDAQSRVETETAARAAMNTQDNETAMTISSAELAHDHRSNLSTGTGINP